MAEIGAQFAERTIGDRRALEQARERNDQQAMRDIAHRLAGMAGMFGFPEIGDRARSLEEAIDGSAAASTTDALYASLIAALERAG